MVHFGQTIALCRCMLANPVFFALLQVGKLGSDQPHASASSLTRVMVIALVVLLALAIAFAVFLIWRSAAGKPRDDSQEGRSAIP